MMIDETPFWMVWSPDHPLDATQFRRRQDAQRKARQMARETGNYFYVLKAQSCHQQQLRMEDFIFAPYGIGAPCPYHGAAR